MEKRTVLVPFEIDKDFVDSVMCTALSGGVNYWVSDVHTNDYKGAKYSSESLSRGATMYFKVDHEQEGEQYTQDSENEDFFIYELTLDKFIEGFKRYIEWSMEVGRTFYTDPCDIDITEADCIIQLALFNEVVFG